MDVGGWDRNRMVSSRHKNTHTQFREVWEGGEMRKDAECFPRRTDKRVKVRAKSKSAYWEKEEVGNVSQRKLGSRMGGST